MPNILFVHMFPTQFVEMHKYLNKTGLATSYLLCGEDSRFKMQTKVENVYSFRPLGDPFSLANYYSGWAEQGAKIGMGVMRAVKNILESKKIDVIIAYHSLGSPQMLFDEVDIPIVTYIEFPSYRLYGWDPKYPPTEEQRFNDKGLEMLSFYEGLKSRAIICPNQYVKKMIPEMLYHKTFVQMDGFDDSKLVRRQKQGRALDKKEGVIYIGFSARVLSAGKGFEQFVIISKELLKIHKNIHFVIFGSPKGQTYGYETQFLEKYHNKKSFKDYCMEKEQADPSHYTFIDHTDYESFSDQLYDVDFFLYPLQTGSNNYGLFELLLRGKIVVASDRCFIPEVIENGVNGFMCGYNDIGSWVNISSQIIENIGRFEDIGNRAKEDGKKYYIANAASKYLEIIGGLTA